MTSALLDALSSAENDDGMMRGMLVTLILMGPPKASAATHATDLIGGVFQDASYTSLRVASGPASSVGVCTSSGARMM